MKKKNLSPEEIIDKFSKPEKKKRGSITIITYLVALILIIFFTLFFALLVQISWNNSISEIFNINQITYWQSVYLCIFIWLIKMVKL